jgi:hypothetical protein
MSGGARSLLLRARVRPAAVSPDDASARDKDEVGPNRSVLVAELEPPAAFAEVLIGLVALSLYAIFRPAEFAALRTRGHPVTWLATPPRYSTSDVHRAKIYARLELAFRRRF